MGLIPSFMFAEVGRTVSLESTSRSSVEAGESESGTGAGTGILGPCLYTLEGSVTQHENGRLVG